MDAKLIYWTAALAVMSAAVASAFLGWREIRRGRVGRHKRRMTAAIVLVLAFVVSYVFKVILLGKEQLELWSPASVTVLRLHETVVLVMVVAGATARFLARRLMTPGAADRARAPHRRAGTTAILAGALALMTATMVLIGMYLRD